MAMLLRGSLLITCVLASAVAADTAPPQGEADRLFTEGRDLLARNDPQAACEKFEAAIKLDPTATGTMLNLGLCYENLHKYATSIFWFRKAQAAAAENKLTEYEEAAKTHTVDIAPKVPTLKLEVNGPPDTDIRIDGNKVAATAYGQVEVDPGTHELVARAPGRKQVTLTVDAPEGEKLKPVAISLDALAVPVYVDKGRGRRRAALILGGAGVAAWTFTLVYGFIQKNAYDEATGPEKNDAKKNLRYIGTSTFIVGTGAVAAAVFLYFTAPRREQISDGTAFAPVITNDQFGLAVSGKF